MILFRVLCVVVLILSVVPGVATAHEVNPAYLETTETEPGIHQVVWKQPVKDGRRLQLTPVFPEGCTSGASSLKAVNAAVVERWQVTCELDQGKIRIDGLDRTLTDVFVRLQYLDGRSASSVLKPAAPVFDLGAPQQDTPVLDYFRIGIDHILFGFDHLLFVLGLCLLVRMRQLLPVITSFTVAHSITLAVSTLGGISLPGPPVEAVIALSTILLGREALIRLSGKETLTSRYPWIVAFGFGLVHGFGFAGALGNIGLPQDQEIWALLLFNLGVEFGQVLFVLAVAGLALVFWRWAKQSEQLTRTVAAYFIGVAGTFWLIERVTAF